MQSLNMLSGHSIRRKTLKIKLKTCANSILFDDIIVKRASHEKQQSAANFWLHQNSLRSILGLMCMRMKHLISSNICLIEPASTKIYYES